MRNVLLLFVCFTATKVCAQEPRLVLPIGHTTYPGKAIFSPDGKKILTISESAKIWDAISGSLLIDLKGHKAKITSAEFSSDGKKIVTGSLDSTARIWDTQTGLCIMQITGHTGEVYYADFSSDGSKILTTSTDSTARIWDCESALQILVLKGHSDMVINVQYSADGRRILTNSADSTVKIWDAEMGELIMTFQQAGKKLSRGTFSPDGLKVAFSDGRNVTIKDLKEGLSTISLKDQSNRIRSFQFSPDGKKILTTFVWDNSAWVWNTESGAKVLQLKGHRNDINDAKFSSTNKTILTSSADGTAKLWDAETGKIITDLKGHFFIVQTAFFSPDEKKIVTASLDNTVKVWDAASGRLLQDLKGHTSKLNAAVYSADGKNIIVASWDSTAKIWDATRGVMKLSLIGHSDWVESAVYSSDGNRIVTSSSDSTAKIWDAASGKLLKVLRGHTNSVNSATFSKDGRQVLTASSDSSIRIWDTTSGMLLKEIKADSSGILGSVYSPDSKKIITTSWNNSCKVWDAESGKLINELKGHRDRVTSARFSANGNKIITTSWDSTARLWDANSGRELFALPHFAYVNFGDFFRDDRVFTTSLDGKVRIWNTETKEVLAIIEINSGTIRSAMLSPGNSNLLVALEDNTNKIFNIGSGKLVCTFFSIDSSDYFTQLPSGYYLSTPAATKLLHYVTSDLKVISFQQLDVKYNRPDKVLEAIGNTDTALINSYRKAYEKRIKKLGIDTTAFRDGYSVPDADFVNRDAIEFEQKNERLTLNINGKDSSYKLDRFNIWVNEAPIFGQRGISLRNKNSNSFDSSIIIKLSQGENRIETSISNVNGTESYRMPLMVNYAPAIKQKEKTHFIGIGIDKFTDAKHNLKYSAKDIRDLANSLKNKYGNNIIIDTLFNENVSISTIKELKQKLLQTAVNDKVIISYSGHGMLSKDFDYYLSTYSVNFENPEEKGLPYDELENLLDSIPARKKLLLIDACHSGEVDKEELEKIKNFAAESTKTRGTKGVQPLFTQGSKKLGMKNSFELMQSLFVNVGKSTGATIISAAAGTQFALERGDLKNGVFTYAILEAMKKKSSMKISELKKIVGERVEELTKGLQKPTSRNETIAVDWEVW